MLNWGKWARPAVSAGWNLLTAVLWPGPTRMAVLPQEQINRMSVGRSGAFTPRPCLRRTSRRRTLVEAESQGLSELQLPGPQTQPQRTSPQEGRGRPRGQKSLLLFQRIQVLHSSQSLRLQWIQCLLLASVGTTPMCIPTHTCRYRSINNLK